MHRVKAIALACLAALLFNGAAFADKRVALVIGNSAYQSVGRLNNPANDSGTMSETLKSAGFDTVDLKRDLKVAEMRRALRDFSDKVANADVAVVYYAGHGMEIDGINYLIPIDAVLERDIDAYDEAVTLDRILTVIEPAKLLRLVILDACRDNPFSQTMKRTIGSRAIGRGLAKIEPTNPNTIIAFAARAGSLASDGDSEHSPFTSALIKYLPKPGLDLRKAFGFTRDDVLKATNNKQEPFVYGSLGGDDVFLVAAPAMATSVSPADPTSAVRRDYELAQQISTKAVWESFISNYPTGFYADLAKAQRDKLIAKAKEIELTEKAKAALEEQTRLAIEGARAAEQAKAGLLLKAAEEARIEAEKKLALQEAKLAEVERTKAAPEVRTEKDGKIAEKHDANDEKPITPIAILTPADQGGHLAPKSSKPNAADIPRLLQAELRRVGCITGATDGNWNAEAQKSLLLFNKNAGTRLDEKVASLDALELVQSKITRVCPLICERGFKAGGENCVKITCEAGFSVSENNECIKKRERPIAMHYEPHANASQRLKAYHRLRAYRARTGIIPGCCND